MQAIISQFVPAHEIGEYYAFGNGHINDTYAVKDTSGVERWVLQRINHIVFPRIEVIQNNIRVVAETLRDSLTARGESDVERRYLNYLPLLSNPEKNYYFDGENYWRLCTYIPDSMNVSVLNEDSARSAGAAFGEFEEMLSSIPEGVIGESIVDFHSMPFRLQQLREAVEKDPKGRVAEVQDMLKEIEERAEAMCIQDRLYAEGKLPKRTVHCDTKVDNVLFDKKGHVLCVVDWDTMMPGFITSDVGDFIRSGVNTAYEDEADHSKISVNMPIYKAFLEGYLSTAGRFLTDLERSLIAYGGRLMTYMQTVRFLTDHINGDVYFKIHHEGHNLQRAKSQMHYLKCLEEKAEEMEALLK